MTSVPRSPVPEAELTEEAVKAAERAYDAAIRAHMDAWLSAAVPLSEIPAPTARPIVRAVLLAAGFRFRSGEGGGEG